MDSYQLLARDKPKYCSVLITNNCMFKCRMCEMWKSIEDERELTIEEWKAILLEMKDLLNPHAEICFTGGEPLLKAGILKLIRFATEVGFRTGLNTNAYLIDEKMAQSISRSSLWSITISLDSLNEDTHDFIRGTPASYRKAINAIEFLSKFCHNLHIGISTVILENNLEDIIDLALWVQGDKRLHSIRFQAMMQPLATPEDREWYRNDIYNLLWPKDADSIRSVLNKLILLKQNGDFGKVNNPVDQLKAFQDYFQSPFDLPRVRKCVFSDTVINLNQIGEIYLCPEMSSIANIKTDNINKIWYSDRTSQMRDEIRKCERSCKFAVNCFWE